MPNTTSSTNKNSYGRKNRRKKFNQFDRKVARVTKQVIAQHEKKVQEMKTFDHPEVVGVSCTNSGLIYALSEGIVQGDAFNQREGDEIILKGLQVRLQVAANSGATYNSVRCVIFRWNSFGAVTPPSCVDFTTSTLIRHLSPTSQDNKKFLQILYDNIFQVADNAATSIGGLAIDKLYIKLAGKAMWNASANNKSGQVWMMFLSDSALIDAPEISFISRLKYVDP